MEFQQICFQVMDAEKVLNKIEKLYGDEGKIEKIDGLGISYKDWRMNLRRSNTEPYIRLNVESRGNKSLLKDKTQEILSIIKECKYKNREAAKAASLFSYFIFHHLFFIITS